MGHVIMEAARAFDEREVELKFRTGVRTRGETLDRELMSSIVDKLVNRGMEVAKIQGYKDPEFVSAKAEVFDHACGLGVAIEIRAKKDRNATMLFLVADRYEKMLADSLAQRDLLIKIIDRSRSIVTARKKLGRVR